MPKINNTKMIDEKSSRSRHKSADTSKQARHLIQLCESTCRQLGEYNLTLMDDNVDAGIDLLDDAFLSQKMEKESLFQCGGGMEASREGTYGGSGKKFDSETQCIQKCESHSHSKWMSDPIKLTTPKLDQDVNPLLREKTAYYTELQKQFRTEALLKERIRKIL